VLAALGGERGEVVSVLRELLALPGCRLAYVSSRWTPGYLRKDGRYVFGHMVEGRCGLPRRWTRSTTARGPCPP
jgi:hypothetical protein